LSKFSPEPTLKSLSRTRIRSKSVDRKPKFDRREAQDRASRTADATLKSLSHTRIRSKQATRKPKFDRCEAQDWASRTADATPERNRRWLGIKHQRIAPQCPWMNGRIERVWSTFKHLLRAFDITNEAELQATLDLLRETYNQHRPHQSLSGHTPIEAWHILKKRKAKRKRPRRRR
jgi:transposase InsO family protein